MFDLTCRFGGRKNEVQRLPADDFVTRSPPNKMPTKTNDIHPRKLTNAPLKWWFEPSSESPKIPGGANIQVPNLSFWGVQNLVGWKNLLLIRHGVFINSPGSPMVSSYPRRSSLHWDHPSLPEKTKKTEGWVWQMGKMCIYIYIYFFLGIYIYISKMLYNSRLNYVSKSMLAMSLGWKTPWTYSSGFDMNIHLKHRWTLTPRCCTSPLSKSVAEFNRKSQKKKSNSPTKQTQNNCWWFKWQNRANQSFRDKKVGPCLWATEKTPWPDFFPQLKQGLN